MADRRRAGGAVFVSAGTVAGAFVQWYLVWLFARVGGPTAVGDYAFLFAVATPLYVVAGLGLRNLYLTHRTPAGLPAYARVRLVALAAASVLLLAAAHWLPGGLLLVVAVTLMKVADTGLDLLNGWFQARGRMRLLGLLLLGNPMLSALAATAAVLGTRAVWAGVLASGAVSVGFVVVSALLIRWRAEPGLPRWLPRPVLIASLPVTAAQLLMSLLVSIPPFVVQRLGSPADVGRYAGAAYLLVAANLAGSTFQTLQLPTFRRRYESDGAAAVRAAGARWAWGTIGLGVLLTALVAVLGNPVLRLLYGSTSFELPVAALVLLGLAATATVAAYFATTSLLVLNAYRAQFAVASVAVVSALLGALVAAVIGLSPVLAGATAAGVGAAGRALAGWYCVRLSGRRPTHGRPLEPRS